MEEIIGIIYAHDTNKIPIVAGFNWAYELTDVKFEPIAYPNVAYVTHPYPQKRENLGKKNGNKIGDLSPIIIR